MTEDRRKVKPCAPMPSRITHLPRPFILYAFVLLIEAQKEMTRKYGSKNIAWRTEAMDSLVEQELLLKNLYECVPPKENSFSQQSPELEFWESLGHAVRQELLLCSYEQRKIRKRHRKTEAETEDEVLGSK